MKNLLKLSHFYSDNIERTDGFWLYTSKGKSVIDLQSGIWCTNIGHQNKVMLDALVTSSRDLLHLHGSFYNNYATELVSLLEEISGIQNPFGTFLSSGSEAVLLGIKLCRFSSEGKKILTFHNAYLNAYNHDFDDTWQLIDYTKCDKCINDCSESCPLLRDIDFNNIGAFLLESVNGRLSIKPPQKLIDFIVSSLSKDALLMANEVTNGFGRTGKWFGYMHYPSFSPDIISMGKGLGNGYPVSALIVNKRASDIAHRNNLIYVQSHQNDPLGCSIALAVVNHIKSNNLIERGNHTGSRFLAELRNSTIDYIESINGHGLLISIGVTEGAAPLIRDELFKRGFFVGCYGDIIHIAPPLNIDYEHLENLIYELKELQSFLYSEDAHIPKNKS